MEKYYCVYMITNKNNNVLYVGITNNLIRRIYEHKSELIEGFSKRYHLVKLVYYEVFSTSYEAIVREKQLKGMLRRKKNELIFKMNPEWKDLYYGLW